MQVYYEQITNEVGQDYLLM